MVAAKNIQNKRSTIVDKPAVRGGDGEIDTGPTTSKDDGSTLSVAAAPRSKDFVLNTTEDSSQFGAASTIATTNFSASGIERASSSSSLFTAFSSDDEGSPSQIIRAPSQKKRRSSDALEKLTINKLQFSKLGLYGREEEIHQLKDRLQHLTAQKKNTTTTSGLKEQAISGTAAPPMSHTTANKQDLNDPPAPVGKQGEQEPQRDLIMISGYSGTGKSALARTLKKPVGLLKGLYVSGKFDLYSRDEPLSAMAAACGQICGEMLALLNTSDDDSNNKNTRLFEQIRDKIIVQLGSELPIITRAVPALEEVVMHGRDFRMDSDTFTAESTEESKNQLNFAFRRFIRVVTSCFGPLVMVLDDLQWADMASLEIIDALITDRGNQNLMIVGLYRSNEVGDTHGLAKMLRDLENKKVRDNFNITNIEVGNLNVQSVHKVIQNLLQDDSSRTFDLAEVCLKKTGGNVFFLIRYLSMLAESMLLEYNLGRFRWMWDIKEIETHTQATDNVVDLLKAHMEGLPESVIQVLKLCAFLGSTFKKETLVLVWRGLFKSATSQNLVGDDALDGELESAKEKGLIEALDNTTYKWIHDKIQEAAMTLVAEDGRKDFGKRVGQVLVSNLNKNDLEAAIFIVVNLLNEGERPSQALERIELAELNLRATQKAALLSSFASSAKYAGRGIDLLAEDGWSKHYTLTRDMYSSAAEAECSLGNTERTESLCRIVLNSNGSIQDKFRSYIVLMDSIANRDRMLEGLELGLDLLRKCGCKFPRSQFGILFETLAGIVKAKSKVKEFCSMETLTKLPIMQDPFRIAQMRVLSKITSYAYLSRQEYLPLVILRGLFWTMKYGLCEYSPTCFASSGIIFASMGDIQTAAAYAQHANVLSEKIDCRSVKSQIVYISHSFSLNWTNPLPVMLKPLLNGYEIGMQTGDAESAGWNVFHYMLIEFQASRPLESIVDDGRVYSRQMDELGKTKQATYINLLWQVCENLAGRAEDPLVLTGNAMDEADYTKRASGKSQHLLPLIVSNRMILYGYMGAYEKCADLALRYGDLSKEIPGSPLVAMSLCQNAISCFDMARRRGPQSRKYKQAALKFFKKIKGLVSQGNPNMQHWMALIRAEFEALNGKIFRAKNDYESAIALAARFGFNQDAALACERYGGFLLSETDDAENGVYQLQQAVRRYSEWGAFGKVEVLEKKFPALRSKPEHIIAVRL